MKAFSSPSDLAFTLAPYTENIEHIRRFLFYSHDGPGLGHVRRDLAVARALTELIADASVLVVTGADEVESLGVPARVGVLKLPSLPSLDGAERQQLPRAEIRALREKVLVAAVDSFRPDVLLVDKHPLGLGGELGPALEIVRASGGLAVLGLPDVLDDPNIVELEWRNRGLFERIPEYYDRVLVYGQPDLLDPVLDCSFPDAVARITSFCGYVVSSPPTKRASPRHATTRSRRPQVLATAGEGEDGFPVLEAFAEASRRAGWQATAVAGAQCPQERLDALRSLAAECGVVIRHFVPGVLSEFSSLDAVVCMGGYNTLAEAAASGVPTICVPRVEPSREQLIRAHAFASRGLLRLVELQDLDPEVLRTEVEAALASGRPAASRHLDLGGHRRAAHHVLELATRRPARPLAERPAPELTLQLAVAATS